MSIASCMLSALYRRPVAETRCCRGGQLFLEGCAKTIAVAETAFHGMTFLFLFSLNHATGGISLCGHEITDDLEHVVQEWYDTSYDAIFCKRLPKKTAPLEQIKSV